MALSELNRKACEKDAPTNLATMYGIAISDDSVMRLFWSKVTKTAECWLWNATKNDKGYGMFGFDRLRRKFLISAHRFAFVMANDIVLTPDQVIDHLCRVRNCVNPDHMEVVTNRENVLRGVGITAACAKAMACVHGHLFTAENMRIDARGFRLCRQCISRRNAEVYKRRRARAIVAASEAKEKR